MKFWKNWPYWLKGGVVGGGVGILSAFLGGESCHQLVCIIFSYGPALILVKFLVFTSLISTEQFTGSLIFWYTMLIASWTLCGTIVGLIMSYIKSRKSGIE
jgi:hypothetical protein